MKRAPAIWAFLLAVAAVIMAPGLINGRGSSGGGGPTHVAIGQAPNGLPFADAVLQPSIVDAEAALGWHIVRPHSCPADDDNIAAIYTSANGDQAAIIYQDLIPEMGCYPVSATGHAEVFAEPSTTEQSPQEMATSLGGGASVQTVAGVPALVLQGNYPGDCGASPLPGQDGCSPAQNNQTSAAFHLSGMDLSVFGDPTWSTAMVVDIANTVS